MAQTITFTGAILRSFQRKPQGGSAHFTANYSKDICEKMNWSGLPDLITQAKLEGTLTGSTLALTPGEKELQKHELRLEITQVDGFEAVRMDLERTTGKGHRIELRFQVKFVAQDSCALMEEYMTRIGEGKGSLRISYVKQDKLPLEDAAAAE